jgi:quercetin dioxygenase-like cupin family protein
MDADSTSEPQVVPFPATGVEPEAPGIASRAVEVNGVRWAVVQYEPGVLREEWCEEGHSGYVLEGAVVYEFQLDRPPLAVGAGEGFTLPDGSAHRGRAGADGARLFLIDRAG